MISSIIRIAALAADFLLPIILIAQSKTLGVGDRLPNVTFNNVINYEKSEVNFSEFAGKFIILEFWSPSCTACIKSFPKIDSLQKLFREKVQFVLVNKETKDSTLRFFSKRKMIKIPGVPFITGDKLLSSQFPKEGFPYIVWIDRNGIIQHIAFEYSITKENLTTFIADKTLYIRTANKKVFNGNLFDYPDRIAKEKIDYYCYITKCIDGLDVSNNERARINDSTIRISATCISIVDLYKKAYREYDKYKFTSPESIILNVRDSNRYLRPSDMNKRDEWSADNSYNFDLVLPFSKKEKAYWIMQQNLSVYFGLHVTIEKGRWEIRKSTF